MAVLDTDIIMRGDRASQPAAASTKKGALYCVTDEDNIIERNTGAAWQAFSPEAGITDLTGDVTATGPGSAAATIADEAVTFAKMQHVATDSLLGRDTAATGDVENILLNATLSMDGSGNLQRAALTGDVTASAGSNTTTIANDAVTNAQAANMAEATIKGRAAGAGTGDPTDLTATQATAILNNFVGDSGAGGTKGLVPAPAAGDAAAGKFLKADGAYAVPAGAGDVVGPASSTDNAFARFDSTTGKLLQNSTNATLDDSGRALFKAIRVPLFDAGNSGTSLTIDWNDGNEQRITLTGNVTLTLNNPGDGGRYVLIFNQDGTGGRTVTWPAAVKWPSGSTPTITSGADKFDLVTLIYLASEGIYLASINQSYDD